MYSNSLPAAMTQAFIGLLVQSFFAWRAKVLTGSFVASSAIAFLAVLQFREFYALVHCNI
jgi:hypothetical protein